MNRTLSVVRLQLINRMTFLWVPALIIGGSFVLSLVIFALIPIDEPKYSGALQAPLWYFLAVGVQALAYTFPFSQAMSVTRRQFFLGTMLTALLTSVALGLLVIIGGALEQATNGWGLNGYYFRLPWMWADGPFVAAFLYFTAAMLLFLIGFVEATIYKRYGSFGVTLSIVGLAAVLVGAIWIVTATGSWPAVGTALGALGPLGLGVIALAVVVLLGSVSFASIRRAIP